MTSESSTSASAASDSLHHKAGNYALLALVGSFVLQFFSFSLAPSLPAGVAVFLGLLPTLVIMSAIPAGIIALCGIPKHGPKRLLWKGLAGVIIPIVLFLASLYVVARLRALTEDMIEKSEEQK